MFSAAELDAARRNTLPVVLRDERPFDLARALESYASGLPRAETRTTQAWRTERWLHDWGCDAAGRRFEGLLGREEAAFWWIAWTHVERLGDSAKEAKSVASLAAEWSASEDVWDRAWCKERLTRFERAAADYYDVWALTAMAPSVTMLRVLLGRATALGLVLESVPAERLSGWVTWLGAAREGPDEAKRMEAMADAWVERHEPELESLPGWVALALHTDSQKVVRAARDAAERLLESDPRMPAQLVGQLADLARADAAPGAFSKWALRHHLVPSPQDAREMVARDGELGIEALVEALDRVARRAAARRHPEAADLVRALVELPDRRFVGSMLDLLERPDTGVAARRWLRHCGPKVADEVVAHALGRPTTRGPALQTLADLRKLHPDAFDAAVSNLNAPDQERLGSAMTGSPTRRWELEDLPAWASELAHSDLWGRALPEPERELLPSLTVAGMELPTEVVDAILARLSDVRLEIDLRSGDVRDEVPSEIAGLRDRLDPASADVFARSLFDVWLRSDARDDLRWAMRSVAFLGWMGALDHLTEVVRNYRQWGTPEDALSCLDALRRHGSSYAKSLLGWLWLHHSAPRIRRHARLELEALANAGRTSVSHLLDSAVPDLGFGSDGRCELAVGADRFEVCLTTDGRVVWSEGPDESDPLRSADARQALDQLRRRVAVITELHARRWERAMIEQRTLDPHEWRRNVLEHPILSHLARAILWKICDEEGELLVGVRVGADLELSGIDDTPEQLSPWDRIGVAHPAELLRPALERWNGIFADYELVQPFEQLDRPVHRPGSTTICGRVIETQELRSRMARHGWEPMRGRNQMIVGFQRHFRHAGITARIDFAEGFAIRPIAAGGLVPEDAELSALTFRDDGGELPAEAVPPAVFSEAAGPFVE